MPTTNSDAAGPAAATRHQEFRIPPQAPRVITARNPEVSTASKPEEQPESSPSKRAPKKPDQTRPMQSASQTAQSAPVSSPRDKPQNTIQQVSRSPSESDPYLIKLAAHLAAKLEQQRIPAMAQLTSPVTVQLELKLLANGALTRARVVEPTGKKGIDEAAYRAALAASPYPEPKGETTDRFEVTLVFTPKR